MAALDDLLQEQFALIDPYDSDPACPTLFNSCHKRDKCSMGH